MPIEYTNYELFQLERFGDILPEPTILPCGDVEGKQEQMDRFAEWHQQQADQSLYNEINHFYESGY